MVHTFHHLPMFELDRQLLFLLNRTWTNPVLDRILGTLSCLDFWVPLIALGTLLLIWRLRLPGFACVLLCVVGVLGNEYLIGNPLKALTNRPRPYQALEGVRRVDLAQSKPRLLSISKPLSVEISPPPPEVKKGRSFPSAHTLNCVTMGIVLSVFLGSRLWLLLPPLMAWSRVYTGSHWPSDVLAALMLGTVFTHSLLAFANRGWRRWAPLLCKSWAEKHPALIPSLENRNANQASQP
jgi:undecaprenyl-diphosphatase